MTIRAEWKAGVAFADEIFVTDATGTGVTGLTLVNFTVTVTLNVNGVITTVPNPAVTLTEIGSGLYAVTFTPLVPGQWYLRLDHSSYGSWHLTVVARTRNVEDLPTTSIFPLSASGRPQVDVEEWAGDPVSPLLFGRVDASLGDAQTNVLNSNSFVAGTLPTGVTTAQIVAAIGLTPGSVAATGTLASFTSAFTQTTNQFWKGSLCVFLTGGLAGQGRLVTDYNGGTKVLTFSTNFAGAVNPTTGDTFLMVPSQYLSLNTTGNIGIDWTNVANSTATVDLSGTTIKNLDNAPPGGGLTAAQVSAAVWDEPRSSHKTSGSFGELGLMLARTGTCQAGSTSSTLKLDAGAPAGTVAFTNAMVAIVGGTGANQIAIITAYDGSTKIAQTTPSWSTTPDATSVFQIYALPGLVLADVRLWSGAGIASVGTGGTIQADVEQWRGAAPAALSGANYVQADVERWAGNAPNVLVAGRVDANVGAVTAGAITSAAFAANALGAVWDELTSGHVTAGTFGKLLGSILFSAAGNVKSDVEEWKASAPNVLIAGRVDANAQVVGDKTGYSLAVAPPTLAQIVNGVWDELESAHTTAGSFGKVMAFLDAAISSRAQPSDVPSSNANADALLDRASAIDGYTVRQAMRLIGAALLGKSSGGPGSPVFRAADNSKPRITATADSDGNRTAITLDPT